MKYIVLVISIAHLFFAISSILFARSEESPTEKDHWYIAAIALFVLAIFYSMGYFHP